MMVEDRGVGDFSEEIIVLRLSIDQQELVVIRESSGLNKGHRQLEEPDQGLVIQAADWSNAADDGNLHLSPKQPLEGKCGSNSIRIRVDGNEHAVLVAELIVKTFQGLSA